ncbi:adenine DNA glycosylase [Skeletonema marinoi]|uniref:Adenine DNA glycosylase n=1 Tax=Skeletonema marinoi TaxID=267567 RepID=A0AAD8Y014_9STRA|nr:adenine DNA glycosylase [Skeletonema marinoi]
MRIVSFVHFAALTARHPISHSHKFLTIRRPLQRQFSYNSLPLQMASSSVKAEAEPRKRSSNSNNTSNSPSRADKKQKSGASSDIELLQSWIKHDNHTYHVETFLTASQAYQIRTRLVSWYRANRRQLPWRGDPGPSYDGSTVGYAASASSTASSKGKKKKGGKKDDGSNDGKDIRSFFGGASKVKRQKTTNESEEEKKEESETPSSMEVKEESNTVEFSAYGVWVSEIMLQQTRVEAVIKYWIKWMDSFPTVHSLANATPEEVNAHWAGLGFYRRARLLHAGAKRVVDEYGGIVPNTVDELMKVEGIGRYTASAIASIAYGVEVPVVDGNVCRVLSRLTGIANHIKAPVMKDDLGWELAEKIVKARSSSASTKADDDNLGTPGEVNQALMELGATYCSPAGSGIDANDPLVEFYVSTRLGRAIGHVANSKDGATRDHIEDLVAKGAFGTDKNKSRCRLCELNGASNAFYSISDRIAADLSTSPNVKLETVSAIAGHACLPIPPPKKAKREEVLAVAVISSRVADDDQLRWLMVKRPSEGLLAGQWEFPNVEVWTSAKADVKKGKKDKAKSKAAIEVPIIDPTKRSKALDSFISGILDEPIAKKKRKQIKDAPITHIFSHVCHTMWIEFNHLDEDIALNKRWKLENGREAGWMSEDDMKDVGITSGVHKILAKVKIM